MKTLIIDTSSNKKIVVGLQIDGGEDKIEQDITVQKAQAALPLIDKLLNKHGLKIADIHAIGVHTGPGSFTGLRVGIAIANALAFALKIPVNGKKAGDVILPSYENTNIDKKLYIVP